MTITLYGWGAMFGLPTPSPFVAKADIQMQMLGLDFARAIADLDSVPKHKAPYVHDNGELIEDSTFIRWHFEKKLGLDLDKGLSAEQRAQAWTLERMLENRLTYLEVCERWMIDSNFEKGPKLFFNGVPEPMRQAVAATVRGDQERNLRGAGFLRFSPDERSQLGARDIGACAALLGDKPYFFGDHATGVDAAAFGVLAACATRYFDGDLRQHVERHANLVSYIERMRQQFFPVDRWPKMG